MIKKALQGLYGLLRDMIDQSWTLVGLAIAWVLLEGQSRIIVGNLILFTIAFWIITYPIRKHKQK